VLKKHAGFACAQQHVACAEVELVHAGNEFNQQQWRHAKPYVQIAEDRLEEAQTLAEGCYPAPAVATLAPMVPVPAPTPVAPRVVQWTVNVVFNFDRHDMKQVRPPSKAELDALIAKLKPLQVQSVQLTGHADRLNSTGRGDYNTRLAQRRVATVRDYLVAQGIDAAFVTTAAQGDAQPVKVCDSTKMRQAELRECLLPNRRVEVVVHAVARD
jgi:outer membrane protein OmpA-like peptidoglycan-associated protein